MVADDPMFANPRPVMKGGPGTIFESEDFMAQFGTIRVQVLFNSLTFWCGGQIRWECDNAGKPLPKYDAEYLQKEAHADGLKQGREEAHRHGRQETETLQQIAYDNGYQAGIAEGFHEGGARCAELEAERAREAPTFHGNSLMLDFRDPGEPIFALRMTEGEAERIGNGLSDLLCWARGFSAALGPDESDRAPMGIEWVRQVREMIQRAQRAAEKARTK